MNNIPNYISIIRIFAAIGLLFVKPFSTWFFFIYLVCGISDVLDGYIARKMNVTSKFGQVIDSISDLIFIAIVLLIIIPIIKLPMWMFYWIVVIAIVRLISVIFGFIRYQRIAFLHTYANKVTGMALFCFPFLYFVFEKETTTILISLIASISAMEELMINLTSKKLCRDRKSIFTN
ncbi:MAG: CDP-alcohol phosphatidyltransferase family protein [Anaerovorax sp.]|nr:CDP-alcohol phosphatidyltransferase family protein [Anaerovorax sp.]